MCVLKTKYLPWSPGNLGWFLFLPFLNLWIFATQRRHKNGGWVYSLSEVMSRLSIWRISFVNFVAGWGLCLLFKFWSKGSPHLWQNAFSLSLWRSSSPFRPDVYDKSLNVHFSKTIFDFVHACAHSNEGFLQLWYALKNTFEDKILTGKNRKNLKIGVIFPQFNSSKDSDFNLSKSEAEHDRKRATESEMLFTNSAPLKTVLPTAHVLCQ